jgi:hypothetical protein
MRALTMGLSLGVAVLALAGAEFAAGQPGKPCHCGPSDGCHCPIPPAGHKPGPAKAAAREEHHEARLAHRERHLEHKESRTEHHEARMNWRASHSWHQNRVAHARLGRREERIENREMRDAHREAWAAHREHRWAWHSPEHFRFYSEGVGPLPYGYHERSRTYAWHEGQPRWSEHMAMNEGYSGGAADGRAMMDGRDEDGGYGPPPDEERRYGEQQFGSEEGPDDDRGMDYGPGDRDEAHGEGGGPGYGDEGPGGYGGDEQGPPDDYAEGNGGEPPMSVNSASALDAWHGYGDACPPYGDDDGE